MIDTTAVFRTFTAAAHSAHDRLTALDQYSGDGDFGDNLCEALDRSMVAIQQDPDRSALESVATVFLDEVGGTSGPLLGLLFDALARATSCDVENGWAVGSAQGLDSICRVGEARVGDRTLVDALAPACAELSASGSFTAASRAAVSAAQGTSELRARQGRASYLGDRAVGAPDPGAIGIALFFWSIAQIAEPDEDHPNLDEILPPVGTA